MLGLAFYLGARRQSETDPDQAGLASQHNSRGVSHALDGKLSEAMDEFDTALAIYTSLIDEEGQREYEFVFARTLNNRTNALRRQPIRFWRTLSCLWQTTPWMGFRNSS